MSRFVVVGCGTVVPEGDRGGSAYWAEVEADGERTARVLLDCGPAAVQAMARLGLPWPVLTDIVITHFHADHVGGLPGLFFGLRHGVFPPRTEPPLTVWGPPGTRRLFDALAGALGDFFLDPGFPVEVRELSPGEAAECTAGMRLSAYKTPHTDESQAVRLDGGGTAFGYTGDTGPAEGLGDFLRGTELLVCECSLTDDLVGDNHLSPSGVARIATPAEPRRLLLTHIYPQVRLAHDVAALVRGAGYGGETAIAREGWAVELGSAGAASAPPRQDDAAMRE